MSDLSLNLAQNQQPLPKMEPKQDTVETSGVIASNQLFNAAPSTETSGSIASSSSSSGGSFNTVA